MLNKDIQRRDSPGVDVKSLDEGRYYVTNPKNGPVTATCFVDVKVSPADANRKVIEVWQVGQNKTYTANCLNGTWSAWDSDVINSDLSNYPVNLYPSETATKIVGLYIGSNKQNMYVRDVAGKEYKIPLTAQ